MNIEEFRNVHRIGPKDYIPTPEEIQYYELAPFKSEFFCTKYAEYVYSVPMASKIGEFIELGVFKGRSIKFLGRLTPDKTWWGFDTFEGIDEIWDLGGKQIDMRQFATPSFDVPSNVRLIKGLFQETLENWRDDVLKDNRISYINMDADVYSATRFAFDVLNSNIQPGCIIRFDELSDWRVIGFETDPEILALGPDTRYTKWQEGEYQALVEWMEIYNREVKPLWRNWHQSAGVVVTK